MTESPKTVIKKIKVPVSLSGSGPGGYIAYAKSIDMSGRYPKKHHIRAHISTPEKKRPIPKMPRTREIA